MKELKRTFLNIVYNAVYQIFLVLVPLITVPYLSRVLGPKTYGIYSSVNNTVQFLMVFCILSLSYIGMRTISRTRTYGSPQDLTDAFWGLWYFQGIAGLITISLTILICSLARIQYWNYILLMLPYLISAQVDISWFFQGLADFGRVVLKNTAVKLVSVVLILLLVKSPADLWKYLLIMSVSTMLGSFVFWFDIHRYIGRPVRHFYKYRTTLRAIITLMIPQIATQIYTSLDKPLLGIFQNSTQVAFYDNSQRISNMILGVITSISLVIMPKMASEGKETQKVVMKKSLEATVMLGTLFSVIIMANTKEFVPFFFGEKFIPMIPLMFFFTLTIIMIPTGGVFANQFALANKRDNRSNFRNHLELSFGSTVWCNWCDDCNFDYRICRFNFEVMGCSGCLSVFLCFSRCSVLFNHCSCYFNCWFSNSEDDSFCIFKYGLKINYYDRDLSSDDVCTEIRL